MILKKEDGYPWYLTFFMFGILFGLYALLQIAFCRAAHAAETPEPAPIWHMVYYPDQEDGLVADSSDGCGGELEYFQRLGCKWVETPPPSEQGSSGRILRGCACFIYDPMDMVEYSSPCVVCKRKRE